MTRNNLCIILISLVQSVMFREDGRSMTSDYFLLLLCKSSIWFTEKQILKIVICFFNTSKCATIYVISLEVYGGFIGQKILNYEGRKVGHLALADLPI